MGKEVDFISYSTSEVVERLADIGRVVVGFVGILRTLLSSVGTLGADKGVTNEPKTYVTCRSF